MAMIQLTTTGVGADRRSVDTILGIEGGPSPRGSTYWTRALHCAREHMLANKLGWHSTYPNNALDTGSIWHYALEEFYKVKQAAQEDRIPDRDIVGSWPKITDQAFFRAGDAEGQKAAYALVNRFGNEEGYEKIYETLVRMLEAYFARYRNDQWEIIAVEPSIMILEGHPNYDGFDYSSRLDLIIIDHMLSSPVMRTIEHKSAWRIDMMITEGYTQDLQVLGQIWVMLNGVDLSAYPTYVGSLVNITSKTKTVGLERVPVSPTAPAMQNWVDAMRQYDRHLLPLYEELNYPQNFASCTRRYGRCEFFNLCRQHPGLNSTALQQMEPMGPTYERTSMMEIKP